MITLSLCMIVKNEEQVLERCLQSCRNVFDEIIIIDTGSTDNTKQIAENFTPNVFDFKWNDNFSQARNFSFSKATCEFIMWLDADDILLPGDAAKLIRLKRALPNNTDAVMMKYNVGFDSSGRVTMSYYRERIIRNTSGFLWEDAVHEYIQVSGNIRYTDICVTHKKTHNSHSDRNLLIYNRMLSEGIPFSTRSKLYYARELKDVGLIKDSIAAYEAFFDCPDGWSEDCISACLELSWCYGQVQDSHNMLASLFRSFQYDKPRPEISCKIGDYHLTKSAYATAAFWYDLALNYEDTSYGGFVYEDYRGYIPALQLCVCWYALGDLKKSMQYNAIAGKIKPEDVSVQYNNEFFRNLNRNTRR